MKSAPPPLPEEGDPGRVLATLNFHLANSPLGVIEWDHEFRVRFWSGRAETLFGWKEAEVLGKHPDDWRFVHEEDVEDVGRVMSELLGSEAPRNISVNRNYTRDGGVVYCEWYNSVLTDPEGRLVSVLSLIHDITARKSTEAQLLHLQKMESLGQLTGGMAHDFNNLLTVILGYADLLAEGLGEGSEMRELSEAIVEAGQKGATLTSQLLAFARQQPLIPRAVRVDALVRDMQELLSRTLGEDAELSLVLPEGLWRARVDPTQLESAILNLCLNARDAMPDGGRIVVEAENAWIEDGTDEPGIAPGDTLEAGRYVVVAVSDTGRGIPRDLRTRVFDPFFTTKEVGTGSGLGLSMVYGFAHQSRGQVRLYSEEGRGTTVRLYLPAAEGGDSDTETHGVTARTPVAPTGTEPILVVEDDPLVRRYAALQLAALGYTVLLAGNGPEAIEVLESGEPVELLFTDVVMPGGMNGAELARAAQSLRPDLPVLFTSGYTENAIVHHGQLDPGVLLLNKPYQRSTLARMVRRALDGS